MIDLDNLKQAWRDSDVRIPDTPRVESTNIARMLSSRQRIVAHERRIALLGIVMAIVIWGIGNRLELSTGLCVTYSLMMTACACASLIFADRARKIDITTLTVREALVRSTGLRTLLNRMQMVLIPAAFAILVAMLYELRSINGDTEHVLFWGCMTGACVGLAIGLRYNMRLRRLIREMNDELRRELSDE